MQGMGQEGRSERGDVRNPESNLTRASGSVGHRAGHPWAAGQTGGYKRPGAAGTAGSTSRGAERVPPAPERLSSTSDLRATPPARPDAGAADAATGPRAGHELAEGHGPLERDGGGVGGGESREGPGGLPAARTGRRPPRKSACRPRGPQPRREASQPPPARRPGTQASLRPAGRRQSARRPGTTARPGHGRDPEAGAAPARTREPRAPLAAPGRSPPPDREPRLGPAAAAAAARPSTRNRTSRLPGPSRPRPLAGTTDEGAQEGPGRRRRPLLAVAGLGALGTLCS